MIKNLTILHSNDIHADFTGTNSKEKNAGGMARLAEYIYQTRRENRDTLYLFAGDMFNGDLLDKVNEGISTLECMNLLGIDAAVPGNHEVDYGLNHLLALNNFRGYPMLCANIYMEKINKYLYDPYKIILVNGIRILIIGLTTEEITSHQEFDLLMKQYCKYVDPLEAVKKALEEAQAEIRADIIILLSHLGIEEDRKLAEKLDPKWGVNLIVGGHTHTAMTEAEIVNGISIAQLYKGTGTVGRFDLQFDTMTGTCTSQWQCVQLTSDFPENQDMKNLIDYYEQQTQEEYGQTITRLNKAAEHTNRYQATMAGNLLCDALLERYQENLDIVFLGSGSLRRDELDQEISEATLINMYFYDEPFFRVVLTGKELKDAVETFLSNYAKSSDGHGEYYQLSKDCKFIYDKKYDNGVDENGNPLPPGKLTTATFKGKDIADDQEFRVGFERLHINNLAKYFGMSAEKAGLIRDQKEKLTPDVRSKLKNYFRAHPTIELPGETEKRTKIIPVEEKES